LATESLTDILAAVPVVPLVGADDTATAVNISRALAAGGLRTVEVIFRTERALECLQAVATEVPEMIVGAGTILTQQQAEQALANGARFIVSPGLSEEVIGVARDNDVDVFPGVATATEMQRAHNLGLGVVKFFPASIAGGLPALKAFSSVFRQLRFMPTGGVSADNLADFLALPAVIACGGSWLTPADAIKRGDYEHISKLAQEAVTIASRARQD
jgi:2-dehydro-3-deoxyphosphogluconate aldolase/(4S)-4-hydroxy-2-oxoglutarate aldolase